MWWKLRARLPRGPDGEAASRVFPGAPSGNDQGAILLLVIMILAFLSLLILSWAREWRTELNLAENFRESRQCRRLAEAGVYYALGKVVMAKAAEKSLITAGQGPGASLPPADAWWGDQRPHLVEMPGGWAEVRVADERGKIDLNRANEQTLTNLFMVLGFSGTRLRTMVDSLLDWRSQEVQSRPLGAKSDYYLRLSPPYVAKNGRFEVVEELAWVRGFEGLALLPRLSDWLTTVEGGGLINPNTAPLEVLLALGFPPDVAQGVILRRQRAPFRSLRDFIDQIYQTQLRQPLIFQSSVFFTIKSTGMINKKGGRHTIKVVVQINMAAKNLWNIVSWVDDFPG